MCSFVCGPDIYIHTETPISRVKMASNGWFGEAEDKFHGGSSCCARTTVSIGGCLKGYLYYLFHEGGSWRKDVAAFLQDFLTNASSCFFLVGRA